MCDKVFKESVTAEIAVESVCTVAVSAHTTARPFAGSDPTDDSVGPVSILKPERRPPAADQLAEVASLTMPDTTDAVIPGVDCAPSADKSGPVAVNTRSSAQVPKSPSRMLQDLQAMRVEQCRGIPLRERLHRQVRA
jgi:hypothetical protein